MAGTPFAKMMVKDGVDGISVEGAANLPYAIPNLAVELTTTGESRARPLVARRWPLAYGLCGRGLHRRGG
jgi:hypothetical protein